MSSDDGRVRVQPGERANRDFVLRLRYGALDVTDSLMLVPDAEGDEGTYQLTVLPPASSTPPRPRDLVLVLDRSGSMGGWKMVAARRAAARIVDTLTGGDRFAVVTFDTRIDRPEGLPDGLAEASDRHRYRAVEHLARVDARGGTELLAPMRRALALLRGAEGREAVVVLVTDGQVGNEEQILRELNSDLQRVRVHTVGIDQAVNAGFLGRLAAVGGGRCELVESEDRLDEAMDAIHRRIGAPLVHGMGLHAEGLTIIPDTASPARMPDIFPGVPLVVAGRYRGSATGSVGLRGTTRDGRDWSLSVAGQPKDAPAVTAQWARSHVRDLEDSYASAPAWGGGTSTRELEKRIINVSLRFGVLCRFTAFVAVDPRVVNESGDLHRVIQPVEASAGWDMLAGTSNTGAFRAAPVFDHAAPVYDQAMPLAAYVENSQPNSYGAAPQQFAAPSAMPPSPTAPPPQRLTRAQRSGGGRMRPASTPNVSATSPGQAELTAAREQARAEARRLRKAGRPADYERRELLADLASRLDALVRHLTAVGVPSWEFSSLTALIAAVEADDAVGTLWDQALQALDGFAAGTTKRRAFWKRG